MGCSASKNVTVEHLDAAENGEVSQKDTVDNESGERRQSLPLSPKDIPPIESEEPPADMLETPIVNNIQKKDSGLAFDLAFEDDTEESIIKKHPPKRFQMVESQQGSPVTLEKLQEKLEEAEMRRQQILSQRVQSAKQRNAIRKPTSESSVNEDENDSQIIDKCSEEHKTTHVD
ncbi:uncharacterized protein LOC123315762 [Coccinella septempunctata]|uniref:uncharacterized protein LOC123315762 n=1 Tax=Coccinella septempunctata TaxID=41139 RepID=UPI001D077582|nr:uncharacterized protein LOC123315762 [Coccinella septempunctata]